MEMEWSPNTANEAMKMRWSPMLVISIFLHLFIFSAVLFVPESFHTKGPYEGTVYEVSLVDMPRAGKKEKAGPPRPSKKKGKTVIKKAAPTKRIALQRKKAKPLVIAKRTIKEHTEKIQKPKTSPTKLIDQAISRIQRKVKAEDKGHLEKAISRLEKEVKDSGGRGTGTGEERGGINPGGILMQLYRAQVEAWIRSNWSYPVAMDKGKDAEAVVVLDVKRDGTILNKSLEKRSSIPMFDESVLKAIERSNPLPPFPEGFTKSYEEFIISFNLKDLEKQ